MNRRKPTDAVRRAVFDAAGGICHICKLVILVPKEKWELEHVEPLWREGADKLPNMRPAHVHCHAEKTAQETVVRAKGKRIREKHIGAKTKRPWAPKAQKVLTPKMEGLRRMREEQFRG